MKVVFYNGLDPDEFRKMLVSLARKSEEQPDAILFVGIHGLSSIEVFDTDTDFKLTNAEAVAWLVNQVKSKGNI